MGLPGIAVMRRSHLVPISGSLRSGSTNSAVLRTLAERQAGAEVGAAGRTGPWIETGRWSAHGPTGLAGLRVAGPGNVGSAGSRDVDARRGPPTAPGWARSAAVRWRAGSLRLD